MFPLITLAQAATDGPTPFNATEATIRNLLYPFVVLVAGIIVKGVSDIRNARLAHVRIVEAMIEEIETIRDSWQMNKQIFEQAFAGGDASTFANRIEQDEKYYPYIVIGASSGLVFSAAENPVVKFDFIRSEVMKQLVKFHDGASLLSELLADLKEKSFQDLPKPRKLQALGVIVGQYARAELHYQPCRDALLDQKEWLTTRSLLWAVLFPVRAQTYRLRPQTYIILAIVGWCVLNAVLRATQVIP